MGVRKDCLGIGGGGGDLITNRRMQTRGKALHRNAEVHLYSPVKLKTHTLSETENRTFGMRGGGGCGLRQSLTQGQARSSGIVPCPARHRDYDPIPRPTGLRTGPMDATTAPAGGSRRRACVRPALGEPPLRRGPAPQARPRRRAGPSACTSCLPYNIRSCLWER